MSKQSILKLGSLTAFLILIMLVVGSFSVYAARAPQNLPAQGMFQIYQQNRDKGIPNYVTEDFILLAYSLTLSQAVTELEKKKLAPALAELVRRLLQNLHSKSEKTPADIGNLQFIKVLNCLLTGRAQCGDRNVDGELSLIYEAGGISFSPLSGMKTDYSQFVVRGKYTENEELKGYFLATRYAGIMLFPVAASPATGVSEGQADRLTAQALNMCRLLMQPDVNKVYLELTQALQALFGPADDLEPQDYLQVSQKSGVFSLAQYRMALLEHARNEGKQPFIIPGLIDKNRLGHMSAADVMTGFRLIPPRFTPASAAFQQLVYGQIGEYTGQGQPFSLGFAGGKMVKAFPLGLELMDLLGSRMASRLLVEHGEKEYPGYKKSRSRAEAMLLKGGGLPASDLHLINYWLARGRPSQWRNGRRLNTCLGFWAAQRYARILYSKQSYSLSAKSMPFNPERKTAWLFPAPELYYQLQMQAQSLGAQLGSKRLTRLGRILERCTHISRVELLAQPLDQEAVVFLNNIDSKLLECTGKRDHPMVVDIHTDPSSGQVLQAALGPPRVISRWRGDKRYMGPVFNYYEFKYPMDKRLTDEAWGEILRDKVKMKALVLSPSAFLNLPH